MAINVEPALSPHLVVDDAASAIDFYVKAFDAVELGRVPGPDGKLIHAALRINGFTVMLNDDVPQMCGGKSMTPTSLGGTPVTIHLTVTDVDAKFQRALNAGATVVTEPPRHVRRLQFLERMGSCQVVHRGGTRRSCVSGRCGWSQRSAVSTIRSGQRSVRSPVYLVLAARRRCVSGCARRRSMPAHGPGPRPKNPLS